MSRLLRAIAAFDQLNAGDPATETLDGEPTPRELAKSRWLSSWVERLEPSPSEPLWLASRCQHLMRWKVKRTEFPDGRTGYHAWRRHMAAFHADEAEKVLREAGYDDETVGAVRRIVLKQGMGSHSDVQTMEDALCLSFMEHELASFAAGQTEEKMLVILRETWRKMSPRGRSHAEGLVPSLPPEIQALIGRALGAIG